MNNYEKNYSTLIKKVLNEGEKITGRNGNTLQITGGQIRADLREGFPLVTGKKVFHKSMAVETEWLLSGRTDLKFLNDRGIKIWDQWAKEDGTLGPVYGHQLINFNGINQIKDFVKAIKENPNSRRHLVTMWNPSDINEMALPPCHYAFQIVSSGKHLDIVVTMRSLDLFIGAPYDVGMYSLILAAVCKETGKEAREVVINASNCHIYTDHIESAKIYVDRDKKELPKLVAIPCFSDFKSEQVELSNYTSDTRLKVKVHK